jgi:hypothetical protein
MGNVNGTISSVIGRDDLTTSQREQWRKDAVNKAKTFAKDKLGVKDTSQLDSRDWQNVLDAGTALEQWRTAALAVIGNNYSVFQAVAAPVLAANKVAVFYGVGIEDVPLPVSQIIFRTGGINGNILYQFDLEHMVNNLECVGYFSEPVVIGPTQPFAVQVVARIATGLFARVQLLAYTIEPKGLTVTGNP